MKIQFNFLLLENKIILRGVKTRSFLGRWKHLLEYYSINLNFDNKIIPSMLLY